MTMASATATASFIRADIMVNFILSEPDKINSCQQTNYNKNQSGNYLFHITTSLVRELLFKN